MQTAHKISFLSALAFVVVFANTNAAHAVSATSGATLFQVAEVSAPVKIAASEDTNTEEKTADQKCANKKCATKKCSADKTGEHKNWLQRHCAGRIFHRKHTDDSMTEDKTNDK